MKILSLTLLPLAALSLTACGKTDGVRAFEEFLGNYTVVSAPEQSEADTCPITEATLRQDELQGHRAVILEARGSRLRGMEGECQSTQTTFLTVTGFPDIECKTSSGYSRCERGADTVEARARREGPLVRIEITSTSSEAGHAVWVLRKK